MQIYATSEEIQQALGEPYIPIILQPKGRNGQGWLNMSLILNITACHIIFKRAI